MFIKATYCLKLSPLCAHITAICISLLAPIGANSFASDFFRPLDRGGQIRVYAARVLSETGRRVISGDCMSACTLWLGYKGTCVTADAVLWFHAATDTLQSLRGGNPWRSISSTGNRALLGAYPPRLRAVVEPWLQSPDFHTLTGRQVASLGVRLCNGTMG